MVAMYHIMKYFLQVVSDDGKKVRRAQPFTERHKEELQVSTSNSEQDKILVPEMETASFICLLLRPNFADSCSVGWSSPRICRMIPLETASRRSLASLAGQNRTHNPL